MNLKELGERFRAERERKGLSVTEVVQRTKISKTNVLALEAGDPEGLPHPVYAKGFVRNYARLLGLDPEECAAIVAANYVAEDNVSVPQPSLDGPDLEILGPGRGRAKLWISGGHSGHRPAGGGVFLQTSHNEAPRRRPPGAPAAGRPRTDPGAASGTGPGAGAGPRADSGAGPGSGTDRGAAAPRAGAAGSRCGCGGPCRFRRCRHSGRRPGCGARSRRCGRGPVRPGARPRGRSRLLCPGASSA